MSCLDGMRLTEAQKAAALDRRSLVLVTAGAGSGKTRLLVAYFVHALLEERLPMERLVAVTFTRKAGAELASRIRASLEEHGRPDLARSVDSAAIGTIHSLCRRLIREHALEVGVDPGCTVLEAEAAELVKEQVSRQAWEQVIEESGEEELEVFASRGDAFRRETVSLYDRLRGMGWECPRVDIEPGLPEEQVRLGLTEAVREALAAGRELDRRSTTLETDLGRLATCLSWLEQPDPERRRKVDPRIFQDFFPSRKTGSLESYFGPVRDALTRYRRVLAEAQLRPVVAAMNELLAQFHRRYEVHKQERGLLDFVDLELRARALLTGRIAGAPAGALPGSHVLVDEFQDTNELQCAILESLGAERLLMVGDERQSIYRFRGADVEVFRRREETLEAGEGGIHRLDVNYRSRPEILVFINRLFSREAFFGSRFVPLRPPDPGDETPPGRGDSGPAGGAVSKGAVASPAVEVLVVGRRQESEPEAPMVLMHEAEAEAVAGHIRRLLDDEGWRQRDIAVLLPAQTYVMHYQKALLARGVEVYVVRGKGYYSQEEVADVTSLLRLLVNPHDDLALVGTLRSPLVGMSDDGLYLLGREARRARASSLWEAVRDRHTRTLGSEDRRALETFVEQYGLLRRRVGRPGLAQLIDDAITACGYDLCLLASPGGKRRFANVRKLMRMASDFEGLEGPDLAGFVVLLGSMGDLSDREGSAPTLAEGEDVVRVMTVHQAKGLEFPVVVLAGLGSDVPHGTSSEFVVGHDGRVGVFLKGSRRSTYEADDLCWGPAAEIVADDRLREREEDNRLLYVAMTRSEDKLVLVGARPGDKQAEKCRIGRILSTLGLEVLPRPGESVALEGLDAVVSGLAPSPSEVTNPEEDEYTQAPALGLEGSVECLQFEDAVLRGTKPRRISFSALAAYQRCPRQFYLEQMLGLVPSGSRPSGDEDAASLPEEALLDDDERRSGREVGLLVHALLERLAVGCGSPSPDVLRAAVQEWLQQTGVHLSPGDQDRASALTLAFWDSPLAWTLSALTASREVPFFFAQGDLMVSGVMDLIDRGENRWRIVDYKTNSLKGQSPAEAASGYGMQAVMYCLAALRAGAPAVQMDFLFLERPDDPVTMSFERDDIPWLEGALDEALDGLRCARFPARGGKACDSCAVAEMCENMARA